MRKGFAAGAIGVLGTGRIGSSTCASALGKGCPPGYIRNSRGICIVPPIPGRGYASYSVGSRSK